MTASALASDIVARLGDTRLVVVANREPYVHVAHVTRARAGRPAARPQARHPHLVDAAGERPRHRARSGDARLRRHLGRARQRSAATARRPTPTAASPCRPTIRPTRSGGCGSPTARREGYYYGLANSALWPLCHIAYARPVFDEPDWRQYVAGQPPLRRHGDRRDRRPPGHRLRAGLPLRAAAAHGQGRRGPTPSSASSGTSRGPTPRRSASARGATRSSTGCSATTCWPSTSSTTATTSCRPVDRALEARDRPRALRRLPRRPPHLRQAVPDQHRSRAVGHGRRPAATGRATSTATRGALGVGDGEARDGRRPPRLHQGHSRTAAGLRPHAGAHGPSGTGRVVFLQIGAPTRDRIDRYHQLGEEVKALVAGDQQRFGTEGVDAGAVPARTPHARGSRRLLPRGRRLRGVVAARRHEPRGQGVHRRPHRRARACSCCRSSPARRARWPTWCP